MIKIGDIIEHDQIWTHGRDFGDGIVIAVGEDWVLLRENYYNIMVLFDNSPGYLEKLKKELKFSPRKVWEDGYKAALEDSMLPRALEGKTKNPYPEAK